MGIVTERQIAITCDKCGYIYTEAWRRDQVIKLARNMGWSFNGKKATCPQCRYIHRSCNNCKASDLEFCNLGYKTSQEFTNGLTPQHTIKVLHPIEHCPKPLTNKAYLNCCRRR